MLKVTVPSYAATEWGQSLLSAAVLGDEPPCKK